ncbi:VOC family protein [Catenovulum sp. 2E275]|uniref:VOC family protein n=1 Tax=Catenovulum sp. 2E275 TaxID=2980497 RepID=UPI0021CFB5A3|nr:VOC family protein [Catenovulum sp. 2E275]MCU4676928.1 VOC family protein [Catenovulum sp. 2E275]
MLLSLHHIQISIAKNGEAAARRFYCDLLGLSEIEKPPHMLKGGGLWLKLADQQIHLGAEDFAARAHTKAHLAYQVNDLEYWKVKLNQADIQFIQPVNIDGMQRILLSDPFGNKIELLELI